MLWHDDAWKKARAHLNYVSPEEYGRMFIRMYIGPK